MLLSDLKLFLDTNNVSDDTRLTFISASTDNPVTDCYLVENLILLTYIDGQSPELCLVP